MNIAFMAHDNKKELMVQFCTAYAGILSRHSLYATNTTGHMVAEATGLNVHCFLSYAHGGSQQIGARIAYDEFDMVLFFSDPNSDAMQSDVPYISRPGRSGLAAHRQSPFPPHRVRKHPEIAAVLDFLRQFA